jgi:hypothetical protein
MFHARTGVVLGVASVMVVGSALVGATISREPVAQAAGAAFSVFVNNDSNHPVPIREQNVDANGNLKVHEQGTVQMAIPATQFSNTISCDLGCQVSLVNANSDTATFFVSSLSFENTGPSSNTATLRVNCPTQNGSIGVTVGPSVSALAGNTGQLTFPQPYALTAPAGCVNQPELYVEIGSNTGGGGVVTAVGYIG